MAQPDDIPVQHIEFDEFYVRPMGDYVLMNEEIFVAQKDETDDGDGENLDMMNENWCLIHPDDVICQEETGGDDEEGC